MSADHQPSRWLQPVRAFSPASRPRSSWPAWCAATFGRGCFWVNCDQAPLRGQQSKASGSAGGCLLVAYAYAEQFSAEVEKLVVMDAFLPGVQGWELAYNNDNMWHFRFHGPTPEALVKGREKIYFAYFWNDLAADKKRSLTAADRNAYVAAYSRPGRMRAGWAYFAAWPDTAKDFAQMAKARLTMPVLSIAGEKASAAILGPQMKLVATTVTAVDLKDTGHWLMEERPEETMEALIAFL